MMRPRFERSKLHAACGASDGDLVGLLEVVGELADELFVLAGMAEEDAGHVTAELVPML
jgi:hypothetical protein